MNDDKTEFLVISRGQWDETASREDIQGAIDRFYAWHDVLVRDGKMKSGQRLAPQARRVTQDFVTDGPFTEAKEVIGGYWFVYAGSLDEAALIAYVKEHHAAYKAPKRVLQIASIGRAANGKLNYKNLRAEALRQLGIS